MTENEAIKVLQYGYDLTELERNSKRLKDLIQAYEMAIKSLEEIQQYRAIGTVERFQQLVEQFKPHMPDKTSCHERKCNKCDKYRKENEKYHEIGTVEECREAREKCIGADGNRKRLTRRSKNETAIYNTPSGDPVKWENNRHKVLQKLATYEDLEEQGRIEQRKGGKMKVNIKKLTETAVIPSRGSGQAAGYDLYACINRKIEIAPHETVMIPTGIATEMQEGTVALIYSRSGLAAKRGLVVCQGTGVIDSDYRGEWFVPLHNDTNTSKVIKPNERIAQVIFSDYIAAEFNEVDELSETGRGDGGFGSTGR